MTNAFHREPRPATPDAATRIREGIALHRDGDPLAALHRYREALEVDPKNADALYLAGLAEATIGEAKAALVRLTKATAADPLNGYAWFTLGELRRASGDFAGAAQALRAGVACEPADAARHDQLGELLVMIGEPCAAERAARVAIELEPGRATAWITLGSALRAQGRARVASGAFERACEIEPGWTIAWDNRLLTLHYVEALEPTAVTRAHREFGERFAPKPGRTPPRTGSAGRRLRVGYVSADFGHHVVSFFIEPVLANHDPDQVEVFCYFNGVQEDPQSEKVRALVPHWRPIASSDDRTALELIRNDRLDIAVDLSGHTAGNRLDLFAQRLAPVQITWLGYPGTTGLTAMDYRLTDAVADPPGLTERLNTETLLRVPRSFLSFRPRPDAPDVTPLPAAGTGRVTFACFNNLAKLTDPVLSLWARILDGVPGARLLLKGRGLGEAALCAALSERFAAAGGDATRLTLESACELHTDHLARYGAADIALDTYPYGGTTTTCEALWQGLPVVSLAGSCHAARVGASLLGQVGSGAWVAHDADEYVAIAIGLARDLPALARTRANLRARVAASPLTDAAGFTKNLEAAYRRIVGSC